MSSGARMTYDESGEARNPAHPTEDDLPRKPKNPKKGTTLVIIVVVVVVLIAASVGAFLATNQHYSPHVALVSKTTAEGFANRGFVAQYVNNTTGDASLNITDDEMVIFSNASVGGLIIISSMEVSSQSFSLYEYNMDYHYMIQGPNGTIYPGIKNGTYEGFSFYYFNRSNDTFHYDENLVAIGVSGSYSFVVEVVGVPLSNYLPLIHDEIRAMNS